LAAPVSYTPAARYRRMMFNWRIAKHGKRASDRPARPATQRRDQVLEAVIARDGIGVQFQPQIDFSTGRTIAVEALARWKGALSADRLFRRAEAGGLHERMSRQVQRKALRVAGAWEGPLRELPISINLLPQDISRDRFDDWLLEEIHHAGLDPRRVTVEITENAILSDQDAVIRRLSRLRSAGLGVALDDFGTGYASFAYLADLPLDTLKIDRGLIADIVSGERNRIVVKAIIRLAGELGLKLVVEGVETADQRTMLSSWGCDAYQGFVSAAAMDQFELAHFVSAVPQAA
jgi:EAL domain-containing protein (putative c-di-GMP-specific phosphodiesterase class I)